MAKVHIKKESEKSKEETRDIKGKRLLRSNNDRMIAGVCGGIGEYLGINPIIIRLLWAIFTLISLGAGIIAYILAWIIIPEE